MKRIIIPVMALIALMSMSFTTNTSSLEIVETANGSYLKNAELLTLDDLETLQQMTVIGKKKVKRVNKKVIKGFINETITKLEDVEFTYDEQLKLDALLNKY
jgi:hypothetical protein